MKVIEARQGYIADLPEFWQLENDDFRRCAHINLISVQGCGLEGDSRVVVRRGIGRRQVFKSVRDLASIRVDSEHYRLLRQVPLFKREKTLPLLASGQI